MEVCQERYCSVVSRAAGEDPAGTAGSYGLFFLLEVPVPWEREIWKTPGFPDGLFDLAAAYQERGVSLRLLCIAPNPVHSRPGMRRLMILRRPEGPMARYEREEYLLPPGDVIGLIRATLDEAPTAPFAPYQVDVTGLRDLLVCTHGTVDAACGRYGYPVYEQLRDRYASDSLRVWRVSHFGGHRFAPTLLDLPEGRWWAHIDPEALDALVHRTGPVGELRAKYRGWGALATPFEQVLERELFEREGWAWVDALKESQVLERCPEGRWAEVRLGFRSPDGTHQGRYQGRVEVSHQVMTGLVSGKGPEPMPQYRVTRLEPIG
ncbi:MAG: sucrase ferredoxin [Bacillota bacterium]